MRVIMCGDGVERPEDQILKAKSHREAYPDQYTHELCGKCVQVFMDDDVAAEGIVERVVQSRWGPLAFLMGNRSVAWAVKDCHVLPPT